MITWLMVSLFAGWGKVLALKGHRDVVTGVKFPKNRFLPCVHWGAQGPHIEVL
jgi:hypothetical protein